MDVKGLSGLALLSAACVAPALAQPPPSAPAQEHPPAVQASPPLDLTPTDGSYVTRTNQPGSRSANGGGSGSGFEFARLDTNRNRIISRSEAEASPRLLEQFHSVDSNNDLQITPEEFAAFEVRQMRSLQRSQPAAAAQPQADRPRRGSWPDPTLAE